MGNFNLCYCISSLLTSIVDIAKYICNIETMIFIDVVTNIACV